jgi:hypothetical protein
MGICHRCLVDFTMAAVGKDEDHENFLVLQWSASSLNRGCNHLNVSFKLMIEQKHFLDNRVG